MHTLYERSATKVVRSDSLFSPDARIIAPKRVSLYKTAVHRRDPDDAIPRATRMRTPELQL